MCKEGAKYSANAKLGQYSGEFDPQSLGSWLNYYGIVDAAGLDQSLERRDAVLESQ